MNHPGSDLKFRITTKIPDFQLSEDHFEIVVKNQYGRVTHRIPKGDCFYDSEGRWYFGIEAVQEGSYIAVFSGRYEDDDYDKQRAVTTDIQPLTRVGRYGMRKQPQPQPPVDEDGYLPGHDVKYEQVWIVSIDGADYLADCDGRYVLTAEGYRIQFSNDVSEIVEDMGKVKMKMKGEEFLQKWEGKNPNGEIDTIPEMLDAAQGISDEETIHEHTERQIEEELEEEAATNEDIDEMFS